MHRSIEQLSVGLASFATGFLCCGSFISNRQRPHRLRMNEGMIFPGFVVAPEVGCRRHSFRRANQSPNQSIHIQKAVVFDALAEPAEGHMSGSVCVLPSLTLLVIILSLPRKHLQLKFCQIPESKPRLRHRGSSSFSLQQTDHTKRNSNKQVLHKQEGSLD